MRKIIINGKEFNYQTGAPLKDVLLLYGMKFPCGGKGQCGKCRIKCSDIDVTDKDKRFLTDNAIKEGWRIACDKVCGEYYIECPPPTRPEKMRELTSCNIAVIIDEREITIGICDDEIAEEIKIPNPLFTEDGLSGILISYEKNSKACTKALRGSLAKESIELFEKYGKAQAEDFVIATNGIFAHILLNLPLDEEIMDYNGRVGTNNLDLPTGNVYFLPIIDTYIGGDFLCESVLYPENTLIIECNDIFRIMSIGKDNNTAVAMWDMDYNEMGLRAIQACIKTILEDKTPFVRLYGRQRESIEKILIDEGLEFTFAEKKLANVAKAIGGLRNRVKLNKEKARTSVLKILSSEKFHEFFSQN